MYTFDPYNVLLAIVTNISMLLMTAFVVQGHMYVYIYIYIYIYIYMCVCVYMCVGIYVCI